jgi:hypothetical protein
MSFGGQLSIAALAERAYTDIDTGDVPRATLAVAPGTRC